MTIRILCDRCGKNMSSITAEKTGAFIHSLEMNLHLCHKCSVAFIDWIDFGSSSEGQKQETEEELASGQGRIPSMEEGNA